MHPPHHYPPLLPPSPDLKSAKGCRFQRRCILGKGRLPHIRIHHHGEVQHTLQLRQQALIKSEHRTPRGEVAERNQATAQAQEGIHSHALAVGHQLIT